VICTEEKGPDRLKLDSPYGVWRKALQYEHAVAANLELDIVPSENLDRHLGMWLHHIRNIAEAKNGCGGKFSQRISVRLEGDSKAVNDPVGIRGWRKA
jgi:hypothetical protein